MNSLKRIKTLQIISAIILLAISCIMGIVLPLNYQVAQASENEVYLGGAPVGLHVKANGLIVQDYKPIITEKGTLYPAKDAGIAIGDLIIRANGNKTLSPKDLQAEIDKNCCIRLTILRNND